MYSNFPECNNFYSFFTNVTKTELRDLLESNGWKIRKESWDDYECINEWSELHLINEENNPLLNGVIANPETNYQILIDMFHLIQANFQTEFYDNEQVMLRCDKNL